LRTTLTEDVLMPIESSVGGISNQVAFDFQAQAERTQNQLKGVITILVVFLFGAGMLYAVRNRQVRRLTERNSEAERGLRTVDAALEQLDSQTRAQVLAKLQEYQRVVAVEPAAPVAPVNRSDDYMR
jgi:hypothetical protein